MAAVVATEPLVPLDYAVAVDADDLDVPPTLPAAVGRPPADRRLGRPGPADRQLRGTRAVPMTPF